MPCGRRGSGTSSRYSLDFEPAATGTYTVVARFPADEDHAGDTTLKISFEMIR